MSENSRWFAEQVLPYEPKLRAWLCLRYPTVRDIDDIIQETYRRLIKSSHTTDLQHPQAYLFAAARSAAVDRIRRSQASPTEDIENPELVDVLVDDEADPSLQLHQRNRMDILADALEALPEKCRAIIRLRKLDGCSYREIAQRLGISEKTVNAHLAVGMAKMRKYLRELDPK